MTLYRKTSPDNRGDKPHPDAFWSYKYGWLEPVEPCEHGKYDGHWPNRKCCCKTYKDGVLGYSFTSFLTPNVIDWKPCWHEPWCDGLEET